MLTLEDLKIDIVERFLLFWGNSQLSTDLLLTLDTFYCFGDCLEDSWLNFEVHIYSEFTTHRAYAESPTKSSFDYLYLFIFIQQTNKIWRNFKFSSLKCPLRRSTPTSCSCGDFSNTNRNFSLNRIDHLLRGHQFFNLNCIVTAFSQ